MSKIFPLIPGIKINSTVCRRSYGAPHRLLANSSRSSGSYSSLLSLSIPQERLVTTMGPLVSPAVSMGHLMSPENPIGPLVAPEAPLGPLVPPGRRLQYPGHEWLGLPLPVLTVMPSEGRLGNAIGEYATLFALRRSVCRLWKLSLCQISLL